MSQLPRDIPDLAQMGPINFAPGTSLPPGTAPLPNAAPAAPPMPAPGVPGAAAAPPAAPPADPAAAAPVAPPAAPAPATDPALPGLEEDPLLAESLQSLILGKQQPDNPTDMRFKTVAGTDGQKENHGTQVAEESNKAPSPQVLGPVAGQAALGGALAPSGPLAGKSLCSVGGERPAAAPASRGDGSAARLDARRKDACRGCSPDRLALIRGLLARRLYKSAFEKADISARLIALAVRVHKDFGDGGYGDVYYHPQTEQAWFVGGDWFEQAQVDKVKALLAKAPGVKEVEVGDESLPPVNQGWYRLDKGKAQPHVRICSTCQQPMKTYVCAHCGPAKEAAWRQRPLKGGRGVPMLQLLQALQQRGLLAEDRPAAPRYFSAAELGARAAGRQP